MIYVLYSGDYEVWLGGNYLPESEVLIEPTRDTLDTFDMLGVPVTLFADLLCVWRYRELGFNEFPEQVDSQLREIVRRGHDVQMHLHPHWPKTDIEVRQDGTSHYDVDGEWIYPGPHMSSIYEFMLHYLTRGKIYLTDLLNQVDKEYRCVAYRAGAYGIMPGEKEILAALEDAGYLIDSSVVPGFPGTVLKPDQIVNFHNVPKQGNYHLSRHGGLDSSVKKGIYEIPVAAVELNQISTLARIKCKALLDKFRNTEKPHTRLGYTIHEGVQKKQSVDEVNLSDRIKRALLRSVSRSHWRMMDIIEDTRLMLDVTEKYIETYSRESEDLFFSVSFHPKDFYPDKRQALAEYHLALTERYGKGIKAISFSEAADLITSHN